MTTATAETAKPASILVASRGKKVTGKPTSGIFTLVGLPKSAKSTLAASFPDSYVFMLEKNGGDRLSGRIHDINTLAEFRDAYRAVLAEPSIKTIVIDTIDVLSEWFADEIAQSRGMGSITERKAGVDGFELWGEYAKRFEALIASLKTCGKLAIVVAHCKDPKLDEKNSVLIPAGINIYGKASALLAAESDLIGYAYKKQVGAGTEYYLTFQGGPLGIWGSRVDEVNDKTVRLDRRDPHGSFAALFGETTAPATEPVGQTTATKKGRK